MTEIASVWVTFVDIGGFTAFINIPELSWRPFNHPTDVVTVGQQITAEVLDVDMDRARVALSLKALQEDPMVEFQQHVGKIVTGPSPSCFLSAPSSGSKTQPAASRDCSMNPN